MHPYLINFHLAGHLIRIPSYGAMLALAFLLSYFESLRRAFKLKEDPRHIENLFLIVVVSSMIGARLFHVIFEDPQYYSAHPSKIWAVWEGGYTFYGAFLMATVTASIYGLKVKLDYFQYADIAGASAMLGLAVGRIGCFLAGCCWGRECHLPWAVTFTHPDAFTDLKGIPLHPAQLYESLGAALIFAFLFWRFERRKFHGEIFLLTLILYSVLRFIVEIFRGDAYRGFVLGGNLSTSQFVSVFLFIAGIAGYAWRLRLARSTKR